MARLSVPHSVVRSFTVPRNASWRENMTVAMLGAWTVGGLFLDGWAHENLGELETFFTPWHGVLYSGLLASILVNGWMVLRRYLGGLSGREAIPPGYALGLIGLAVFAVGGFADLLWHTAFGIEQSIDALLSPPHLTMFFGALLALTSPLRAAWASSDDEEGRPSLVRLLPVVLAIALATAVVAFFFMYLSVFTNSEVSGSRLGRRVTGTLRMYSQQVGIASILMTNVILFAPLLLLMRRWTLPAGSIVITIGMTAVLLAAVREFTYWHAVVAALLGAGVLEVLKAALRVTAARRTGFRLFAGVGPLVFWAIYLGTSLATRGIVWSLELTLGVLIWTALSGVALSVLLLPPPLPERSQSA
jgi:hypothetical protein